MSTFALPDLPKCWNNVLGEKFVQSTLSELTHFLTVEIKEHTLFPPTPEIFNAFALTSFDTLKVVILGQDPYHGPGQAHGLAFSVREGVLPPPSLKNIFKELSDDVGCSYPKSGDLSGWAKQGVLLLNTLLSVRAAEPFSHKNHGWEQFTDEVIRVISGRKEHVVFVLWGASAQKKAVLIDTQKHLILYAPHPSPLSSHRGFFGSKPFSTTNRYLLGEGLTPIDWCSL